MNKNGVLTLTPLFSTKLLAVFQPFMDRGIIKEIFTPNFTKLTHLFGVELETCKYLLDSQRKQVSV